MTILYDERLDGALPDVDRQALIQALRQQLPELELLDQEQQLKPYECDGLSAYRCTSMLVALPRHLDQVQRILQICHAHRVPVVARGAGTGLSGGALPLEKGLLLVMARFKEILQIDPAARCARLQPGVRNLAISQAAAPWGLYYAPDPSSQIACSIGGNVAENAGGVHCLKYGLTVHNLLKVQMLSVEGQPLTLGSEALDAPGFDLLALFTGSEGLLGVITEVTVKLLPKPQIAKVLLAAFDSVEAAGRAVADIIAAGIIPGGLEMMDNLAIRAAEDFIHAATGGPPRPSCCASWTAWKPMSTTIASGCARCWNRPAPARCAWPGTRPSACVSGPGARTPSRRWGACPRTTTAWTAPFPAASCRGWLRGIARLADEHQLRVANVFHAGDGNMHPLILFDANQPGELERAEALGGKILELCVAVGGSITGEHGVGREKINQMCAQFNHHELTLFHAIKAAFDPSGLLNPGKNIPTLHRCAEFGAMHIHHGQLPFPELERF